MLNLGLIGFAAPWMLLTLIALPILWFLLRVTPPAPRAMAFPAIRLLFGLENREETSASSPWWLILLRLLAAAFLILALAHPLLTPGKQLPGNGPLVLVIDDGWAAARDWSERQEVLHQNIDQAAREGRSVMLLTTAESAAGHPPLVSGLLRPADAHTRISALQPKPWESDRSLVLAAVRKLNVEGAAAVMWLHDGLQDDVTYPLAQALQRLGSLRVMEPASGRLPALLLPPLETSQKISARLVRPHEGPELSAQVRVTAVDGRLLAREVANFADKATSTLLEIELPLELRNEAARIEIENENTAGSVLLLDERWRRRPVGIVTDNQSDQGPTFLSEIYYVERALRPFNEIAQAPVDDLLSRNVSTIVVPDSAILTESDVQKLETWAAAGGLVLRFAGPRLARNTNDAFVPTALRRGGRTLRGAMLWTQPAVLAGFDQDSPFNGLPIPDDVTVSRQVLAEPTIDLNDRTWARLTDGTPLVTAKRLDQGWLVLAHTTSNAEWSNLPLSGLFVSMLQRVVAMSVGVRGDVKSKRPMPPIEVLNGFGQPAKPASAAKAVLPQEWDDIRINAAHPPGLYGFETTRAALNLGSHVTKFDVLGDLPQGVERTGYERRSETDLKPWLLVLALVLILLDTAVTFWLRGLTPRTRRAAVASVVVAIFIGTLWLGGDKAVAQTAPPGALETRLAYVITGERDIDRTSEAGLIGLSNILNRRTAVEAAGPVGVDLETDELSFYALLYWPVSLQQQPPSAAALQRLNQFIAHGGTIFFDLRDQLYGAGLNSASGTHLQVLTAGLDIPPLAPVEPAHVLTKAFYLMQDFPGRWAGGQLWVERPGERVNDGVSSVIVGSNDWAGAWATDANGTVVYPVVPGGERQREMAYRFGVNLVMYTLTGNYKSDQVHVPSILERLGQ